MPKQKPTKTELAQFKVMSDLGKTPNAIANATGRDPKTVRKYLSSLEVWNDPDIAEKVAVIKEGELNSLYVLSSKAHLRLHELLDEGNTKVIETIALMDRAFQQRRLLENESTGNLSIQGIVEHHDKMANQLQKELDELRVEDELGTEDNEKN